MIMKITPKQGGFTVWSRTKGMSGANELLYFKPKPGDILSFIITLKNRSFPNYNDLPATPAADNMFYFNNQVPDATAPKTDLHLSINVLGVDNSDTWKKVTTKYTYVHPSNIASGNASLRHNTTGLQIQPASHINHDGKGHVSFDLTAFPEGQCEILIGGVSVEKAYHLAMSDVPVFAVLEFSLEELVLANYRIIENDGSLTPERPRYTITFNNRATLWRYKVQLEENSPLYTEINNLPLPERSDFLNRINIISNDTNLEFVPNIISDRQFEFISNTTKLLQESYISSSSTTGDPLSLMLRKHVNHPTIPPEDIKVNLPYPSDNQLDATNDPIIYSDVLINL